MTDISGTAAPEAPRETFAAAMPARRTDLDALRILLCGAIVLAHAMLIFADEPRYHIKSETPSLAASIAYEFIHATTLPVFFALAGWSALISLRGRSAVRFARERASRLLLPLAVGIVVFGSVIKYIELSHGRDLGFHGLRLVEPLQIGFLEFFPRNLKHLKLLTWSHLWFLGYQFVISLLFLPLLLPFARCAPITGVPRAHIAYLPLVPLAAVLVAFNGYWPFVPSLIHDWGNFCFYALCFLLGAAIAFWPDFETCLRIEAPRLFVLMLAGFGGLVLCGDSTAGRLFVALTSWGAIGAGLGLAARARPAPTPALAYLSEATLPVYVVHHVFVLLIGAALLPLALPVWFKIAAIFVGGSATSLAVYHWLIRSSPSARWLMGIVAAPKKAAVVAPRKLAST